MLTQLNKNFYLKNVNSYLIYTYYNLFLFKKEKSISFSLK